LFSILASNPNLRQLLLSNTALPDDADGSTVKVPLCDLEVLSLTGEFRRIFGLLRRLILPETLVSIHLDAYNSTVEDISQTLGPYIQGYFPRDARYQGTSEVSTFFFPGSISISALVIYDETPALVRNRLFVEFAVGLAGPTPPDVQEELFIDLIKHIPREVVALSAEFHVKLPDEVFLMMPNINTLRISGVEVSEGFLQPDPNGPHANTKLIPSLECLTLEDVIVNDNAWGHLTAYLAHQTSDNQIISLNIVGGSLNIRPEVVNEITGLVQEFTYSQDTGDDEDWEFP
jgi:hypothetical protein